MVFWRLLLVFIPLFLGTNGLFIRNKEPDVPVIFARQQEAQHRPRCSPDGTEKIVKCSARFQNLTYHGYPWRLHAPIVPIIYNTSVINQTTLFDPMKEVHKVCEAFGVFQECISSDDLDPVCLVADDIVNESPFISNITFSTICSKKDKPEVVGALECLREEKILSHLELIITAGACPLQVLDQHMQIRTQAWMKFLTLDPDRLNGTTMMLSRFFEMGLMCMPDDAMKQCVEPLIGKSCGKVAVSLVREYFSALTSSVDRLLRKVGAPFSLCGSTGALELPQSQPPKEDYSRVWEPSIGLKPNHSQMAKGKHEYETFMRQQRKGSLLETTYGRWLANKIYRRTPEEFCSLRNLTAQFHACALLGDEPGTKSRHNILQFVHHIDLEPYQGARCGPRLPIFDHCWKIMRNTCFQAIGLDHQYQILMGGCVVMKLMDQAGCAWQQILATYYIEAQEKLNIPWPFAFHHPYNRLGIQNRKYEYGTILDAMQFIALPFFQKPIQRQLAKRCGDNAKKYLVEDVYGVIRFSLYDLLKMKDELDHGVEGY